MWSNDPVLKEAGRLNHQMWKTGLEGWSMWLLTKFGTPRPWTMEQVHVYVAKTRADIVNPQHHMYHYS